MGKELGEPLKLPLQALWRDCEVELLSAGSFGRCYGQPPASLLAELGGWQDSVREALGGVADAASREGLDYLATQGAPALLELASLPLHRQEPLFQFRCFLGGPLSFSDCLTRCSPQGIKLSRRAFHLALAL